MTYVKRIDETQTPCQIDIGLGENNAFAAAVVSDAVAARPGRIGVDQISTTNDGTAVVTLPSVDTPVPLSTISMGWLNDSNELTMKGIYELDGDRVTYCWSAPGQERPTSFSADKGSQQTLVSLERFSTGEEKIEALLRNAGADVRKDEIGWIISVSIQQRKAQPLLEAIAPLQKLWTLHINEGDLRQDDFTTIAGMHSLATVEVRAATTTFAGLEHIAALPRLNELTLAGAAVTDDTLAKVRQLTQVRRLRLKNASVTDYGIAALDGLKLDMLQVSGPDITDAAIASVVQNTPEITGLLLDRTSITDAGAELMLSLDQLDFLRIPHTKITDAGIQSLAKLPKLQNLYMNDTTVTDVALRAIAEGMPELMMLDIRNNPELKDEGLASLANHPALRTIHVSRGQFSKATIEHMREVNGRLHVH